jgi:hypothetical protein
MEIGKIKKKKKNVDANGFGIWEIFRFLACPTQSDNTPYKCTVKTFWGFVIVCLFLFFCTELYGIVSLPANI